MTKTEHYQLNQWDASDYVRREDFNEDNRKIEEALGDILEFSKTAPGCVSGSYTGTGSSITVDIGVQPSFLVVLCEHSGSSQSADVMGILGVDGFMLAIRRSNPSTIYTPCRFTETGFTLSDSNSTGMNINNMTYRYAAFY